MEVMSDRAEMNRDRSLPTYLELAKALASERAKRVEAEAIIEKIEALPRNTIHAQDDGHLYFVDGYLLEAALSKFRGMLCPACMKGDHCNCLGDPGVQPCDCGCGPVLDGSNATLANAETSALARHDAEVAARALEEAADSLDYPDLRWNTTEFTAIAKFQKMLRARAATEKRADQ